MLRSWLGLTLGTAAILAASCSSDDAKKKPFEGTESAGQGGNGRDDVSSSGGANDGGSAPLPSDAAGASGETGSGGDGASTLTDGWLSGTRLRAALDVAGSAKLFRVWHDTQLDVDCSFALDQNGDERCLPVWSAGYASYADADCTQAVLALDAGQPAPSYAAEPVQPFECGKGARYFHPGATIAVTATYNKSSGTCMKEGPPSPTLIFKRLDALVPETTFVSSKMVREPRDQRLSANVRVASDGAREVTSHHDLQRDADCNPRLHQGDGYGCVPEDRAYIEVFFSDDVCKVPAAYHPGYAQQVCGRAPKIVQDSSPFNTDGYFEVGDPAPSSLFRKDSVKCAPYTLDGDPGGTFFSVGKPVAFSSFPPLTSKNEGSGRILINVLRGPGTELVSREEFFDSKLGVACGAGPAIDSMMRCLPHTLFNVNAFTDAKCSQALFTLPAGQALPADLEFLESNAPAGGTAVFKIGAKISAPAKTFELNGLDCVEQPVFADTDYYATTSVAPSELVPVERQVE